MRTSFALPLLALLALLPGPSESAEGPDDAARIQLAAARAPGDLVSDAYLVKMMDGILQSDAQEAALDPELRDKLSGARDELQQRVAAGMSDEPVLLATLSNCFGRHARQEDCEQVWARLEEMADGNGYRHFVLMGQAAQEGDDEGFERHALRMIESPHFEPDAIPVFVSLYKRYRQVPDFLWTHPESQYGPKATAGVLAMALSAAVALPGYQQLLRACDGDEKREICAKVALHMAERSTLLIDRSVAISLLRKVGHPAELERAEVLERESRWLQSTMVQFDQELDDSEMGEYFDIFASEGEFAALHFAARATGRPVNPPVDWQP